MITARSRWRASERQLSQNKRAGYFGVRTESDYAQMQMDMLEGLLRKDVLSDSERVAARQLMADFEKVPESASPMLVGQFRQMKMRFADRVKDVFGL